MEAKDQQEKALIIKSERNDEEIKYDVNEDV